LKSHRPALGALEAWARWHVMQAILLVLDDPRVLVVVIAGSSIGTSGR
jgi:hypothetical protein